MLQRHIAVQQCVLAVQQYVLVVQQYLLAAQQYVIVALQYAGVYCNVALQTLQTSMQRNTSTKRTCNVT
jgi:hypothetical protein